MKLSDYIYYKGFTIHRISNSLFEVLYGQHEVFTSLREAKNHITNNILYKPSMTDEEKQFKEQNMAKYDSGFDTAKHRFMVQLYLNGLIKELINRGEKHDQSKIEDPEKTVFDVYTPKLAEMTYGSDEYIQCLKEMKDTALNHHYANNNHHPEHYANGVNDMDLVDVIEMICDWKAASKRHNDGNIQKSLELNKDRFHIDAQLYSILKNTVDRYMKE